HREFGSCFRRQGDRHRCEQTRIHLQVIAMDRTVLKRTLLHHLVALSAIIALASPAFASSRIKDIGHFSGVRSNPLIGYGLVIGLNKTGEKCQTFLPQQTLLNMLERLGIPVNNPAIRVENIAAVMVTADLGAFERAGSRIDVTVSSIGDATSLQGGI